MQPRGGCCWTTNSSGPLRRRGTAGARLGRGREGALGGIFAKLAFRHAAILEQRCPTCTQTPRRRERLFLQGVEGHASIRTKMKPEDMLAVLRRAPADGRDQQHLLPDAQDRGARELGAHDARDVPLRHQGVAPHHAHGAAQGGQRRRFGRRISTEPRRARRQARPGAVPAAAVPEEGPAAAARLPRAAARRTIAPRSSSATTRWFADDVYDALKGAGAALCLSEREDNAPPPLVETAPWGYVRLRLENYSDADLRAVGARGSRRPAGARSTSTSCTSRPRRPTRRR